MDAEPRPEDYFGEGSNGREVDENIVELEVLEEFRVIVFDLVDGFVRAHWVRDKELFARFLDAEGGFILASGREIVRCIDFLATCGDETNCRICLLHEVHDG